MQSAILAGFDADPFSGTESNPETGSPDDPSGPGSDPYAPQTKSAGDRQDIAERDIEDPKDGQGQRGGENSIISSAKGVGHRVCQGPEKDQRGDRTVKEQRDHPCAFRAGIILTEQDGKQGEEHKREEDQ